VLCTICFVHKLYSINKPYFQLKLIMLSKFSLWVGIAHKHSHIPSSWSILISCIKLKVVYSGIPILRTLNGNGNWFGKSESSRNRGYSTEKRKRLLVLVIGRFVKLRFEKSVLHCQLCQHNKSCSTVWVLAAPSDFVLVPIFVRQKLAKFNFLIGILTKQVTSGSVLHTYWRDIQGHNWKFMSI